MTPGLLDDDLLRALLREDAPHGDLSTQGLGLNQQPATVEFWSRGAMTVSAIEAAARLFSLCGVAAEAKLSSGQAVPANRLLLAGQGPAAGVLLAWKTAQTLVEACSGIASAAAAIVQTLRSAGFTTPLACTRKNFPGTRHWTAQAVVHGGAVLHRAGLSETLLVFPEHRALLGDDWPAVLARLKQQQPEKRLVVEVGSAEDALAAARAGADVLQLERFSPQALAELKAWLPRQLPPEHAQHPPRLAPAGGVTQANALAYAQAGADFLVSSAPYFAPPADVQVRIGAVAG